MEQDYLFIQELLSKIPDVRIDKVNEIKEKIKNNTYNISNEELADKIIQRYNKESHS